MPIWFGADIVWCPLWRQRGTARHLSYDYGLGLASTGVPHPHRTSRRRRGGWRNSGCPDNEISRQLFQRRPRYGIARAGDVPASGPVIVKGVYTIDVSNISTDVLRGHADYVERKELLNDIALILRIGQHPPPLRMPILETMRRKELVYWRYPN